MFTIASNKQVACKPFPDQQKVVRHEQRGGIAALAHQHELVELEVAVPYLPLDNDEIYIQKGWKVLVRADGIKTYGAKPMKVPGTNQEFILVPESAILIVNPA